MKRKKGIKTRRMSKILYQMEGTVQMTRDGYCFVIPDKKNEKERPVSEDERDDVFVRANKTLGALNGDRVRVAVTKKTERPKSFRGRTVAASRRCEGIVTDILARNPRPFVGFLHIAYGRAWVLMQSRVMPYDILLSDVPEDARQGYKVAAVVDNWPKGSPNPVGHIVQVLGAPGENDTEMHAILAEFGLPYSFEDRVEQAAGEISDKITPAEIASRRDFRDTLTFTIDPSDAKDFDDALSFRHLPNGETEVGVHIADVTHYVLPDSVLDIQARERGTSVYLADRTVPMLPERLSNNLCSLRPGEDKLCFSAVFTLDSSACVTGRWFGSTVINSDRRLDYDGAQAIIMKERAEDETESAIRELWSLASILREKRFSSGAISFERPELKVICDEKGRPVDVVQKTSCEANWLIEEFMLLANRSVAEFVSLKFRDRPFVYRVHDDPDPDKLESLRTFAKAFGYDFPPDLGGERISTALNKLFETARDTPEYPAIELMALRSMARARYDVENIGHFGLGFKYYTHFTSPIRRYPDMMVHRLLRACLSSEKIRDKAYYTAECRHASEREQVATEAERASVKYKTAEYMRERIGYTYSGTVSGLTEWGIYVEVEPTHIEGMVPLRNVKSDYFEFDEAKQVITGRHTRRKFTLGSKVKIKVSAADAEQRTIDFELIEE